jgi:hypothetical protein
MNKKMQTSRGSASRVLLILAAVIIFFTIVVYFLLKYAQTQKAAVSPGQDGTTQNEPPKPVYDTTIGDIKFSLQRSLDLGSFLKGNSYQPNLTTTEKLIWVTVGGQNKGKIAIDPYLWDLGNIVDSDGRNFTPITNKAYFWLPKPDLCGAELKPEFEPIPCVRIYEVSKESKGLKIEVISRLKNATKKQNALLDLDL